MVAKELWSFSLVVYQNSERFLQMLRMDVIFRNAKTVINNHMLAVYRPALERIKSDLKWYSRHFPDNRRLYINYQLDAL